MQKDSIVARISRLQPGECFAQAVRVPDGEVFTARDLADRLDGMANSLRPAALRAAAGVADGRARYTVETQHFISRAKAVLITGIVTRLE